MIEKSILNVELNLNWYIAPGDDYIGVLTVCMPM